MKTVFVGQQPASYEDEGIALPFKPNSTGSRLVKLMGITEEAFAEHFIRVNVSPVFDPEGFTPEYHRPYAENLLPLFEGRMVVFLGPAVALSFGITRDDFQYCQWKDHKTHHLLWAVIPHPSGLNRLYNDPQISDEVRDLMNYVWRQKDD